MLPPICDSLNFLETTDRRSLQFEGALCEPNVLETARRNPLLSTFVNLIDVAGLQEIFVCPGPFTLLTPLNAAFDALDPALVEELLLPENLTKLQDLLLYHIVPGLSLPGDLVPGPLDTLLEGQVVQVSVDPGITFNQAQVEGDNVLACNGALYLINDVLVPGTNATN